MKVPLAMPCQRAEGSEGESRSGGEQTHFAPEKFSPRSLSARSQRYCGQVSAYMGRSLLGVKSACLHVLSVKMAWGP